MAIDKPKVGIVGGSGMLGLALSQALLSTGVVNETNFWASNRSGNRQDFSAWPNTTVTTQNQTLIEACDVIVLCVPPSQLTALSINCKDKLVISVMAGVSLSTLEEITGSKHIVRAMSSPAAAKQLAYSPWIASDLVTLEERQLVSLLLNACGQSDELHVESHIDIFTAMTGPVPGFVAYFAECVTKFATDKGVSPDIADRAVKQLFLAAGTMMANGHTTPKDDVNAMVNYDGTTAAGLRCMQKSSLATDISAGLQAAVNKTRTMR